MRKYFLVVLLSFIGLFVFALPNRVSAREVLAHEEMKHITTQNVVGEITLYDDYIVEYDYKTNQLTDVKIKICKVNICNETDDYQVNPMQTFMNGQEANFDISDYIVKEEKKVTYRIIATGRVKTPDTGAPYALELQYDVVVNGENETDDNMGEEDFDDSMANVKKVFNTWIIPGIYIALAVAIIVKGIFLAIDIIKYADNPEIRKQKLQATVYLFLALLLVALINTGVGFITGLFNK